MDLRKLMCRIAPALAALLIASAPRAAAAAQPFFLYGASFFYERVPRAQWAPALEQYKALGINTIDLYVMWNWHELRDGVFDFTGRSNPRRDLAGLLRLIHDDGFHIVLRPGPVIRNEWRNGGYPAWLLTRPEYHMPLHDVLEGRYPATATLQNQRSDAAAAEWLNNATHMRYATRWLRRVFAVAKPYRSDIIAVAVDDDQGAYLDNDTWPGPHFHRYIDTLATIARQSLGPSMPVFINTFQMKVTASAPVWTWGNWYQSDAYSIGEHDRSQIEFSTGLLQTQSPQRPIMISEFQAGWLQGADQAFPRSADPSNTTLALHTMLQMGAHGVVNFPVQDTLNPSGWEAPWTNAFYSWDAAYSVQLTPQRRSTPTAAFGKLMADYGSQIVQTHPVMDAAVAYLTSAYTAGSLSNADVAQIAQATIAAQRGCRIMRITCGLVDLRYISQSDLDAYRTLILPPSGVAGSQVSQARAKLAAYRAHGGRVVSSARAAEVATPAAGGIPNAALLANNDGSIAFLDVVNYGNSILHTSPARVHVGPRTYDVAALAVPARDALLMPLSRQAVILSGGAPRPSGVILSGGAPRPSGVILSGGAPRPSGVILSGGAPRPSGVILSGGAPRRSRRTESTSKQLPLSPNSFITADLRPVVPNTALAYVTDVYNDGYPAVVMENGSIRLIVSPCAGARALVFEDKRTGTNLFTTIGGLRDAWSPALPSSPRDYIAKYTHPIATGTFNRCYSYRVQNGSHAASAAFFYTAPDAPGGAASFKRTIRLSAANSAFQVEASASFAASNTERALQITSLALAPNSVVLHVSNGVGVYDPANGIVTLVAWRGGLTASALQAHPHDALLTLTLAHGISVIDYGVESASSQAQAQAVLRRFANRGPSDQSGEVAER